MWGVTIRKKALKNVKKLPESVQERFKALALELKTTGPVQAAWPNYSKIQGAQQCHHCHLKKGHPTYVAIWKVIGDHKLEVTYIGTHERADYQRLC